MLPASVFHGITCCELVLLSFFFQRKRKDNLTSSFRFHGINPRLNDSVGQAPQFPIALYFLQFAPPRRGCFPISIFSFIEPLRGSEYIRHFHFPGFHPGLPTFYPFGVSTLSFKNFQIHSTSSNKLALFRSKAPLAEGFGEAPTSSTAIKLPP